MNGWRAAQSLIVLRNQIDALYPNRNKASDGTIGDAAHQSTYSEHNPDEDGLVRALDITHDPRSGCDIDRITDWLAESRDPRIEYLIANELIMSGNGGPYPWQWRAYFGDDPHRGHFHLTVFKENGDDPSPWKLGNDMEQTERLLAETGRDVRTVAEHFGDLQRLRGWLIGETGKAADVPPPGSPLARILNAADRMQPVTLTSEQLQTLCQTLSASIETALQDAVEQALRNVFGSLG